MLQALEAWKEGDKEMGSQADKKKGGKKKGGQGDGET
jgi:hypothetical protein